MLLQKKAGIVDSIHLQPDAGHQHMCSASADLLILICQGLGLRCQGGFKHCIKSCPVSYTAKLLTWNING